MLPLTEIESCRCSLFRCLHRFCCPILFHWIIVGTAAISLWDTRSCAQDEPKDLVQDSVSEELRAARFLFTLPKHDRLEPLPFPEREVLSDSLGGGSKATARIGYFDTGYPGVQRRESILELENSPLAVDNSFTFVAWFAQRDEAIGGSTYLLRVGDARARHDWSLYFTNRGTLRMEYGDDRATAEVLQAALTARPGPLNFLAIRYDADSDPQNCHVVVGNEILKLPVGPIRKATARLQLGGGNAEPTQIAMFDSAIEDQQLANLAHFPELKPVEIAQVVNRDRERAGAIQLEKVAELKGPKRPIDAICFSPDSKSIYAVAGDPALFCWDVDTQQLTYSAEIPPSPRGLEVSVDGMYVAATGHSGQSIHFSNDGSRATAQTNGQELHASGHALVFLPEGQGVAYSIGGELHKFSLAAPDSIEIVNAGAGDIRALKLSPNQKLLITAHNAAKAIVWDSQSLDIVQTFEEHRGKVYDVDISPNNLFAVSASEDRTARIWEVNNGKSVHVLTGHADGVKSAVFVDGGKYVATGSYDGSLRIWDVNSGEMVLSRAGLGANYVRASPDGCLLACAGINISRSQPIAEQSSDLVTVFKIK